MLNLPMETKKIILSNKETRELIAKAQSGNKDAKDRLVEFNIRLVMHVTMRFENRGYDLEDLFQVGTIGLIKAINKFDLNYNVKFSTYAVPMICGEIQRFLRDDGIIKVSRLQKELGYKVIRMENEFVVKFGRKPTEYELAEELETTPEEIILAKETLKISKPESIYTVVHEDDGDSITLMDRIYYESNWEEKFLLNTSLDCLDERSKLIIKLRYFNDRTQTEVAEILGISQVQVSRLENAAIKSLRIEMGVEKVRKKNTSKDVKSELIRLYNEGKEKREIMSILNIGSSNYNNAISRYIKEGLVERRPRNKMLIQFNQFKSLASQGKSKEEIMDIMKINKHVFWRLNGEYKKKNLA